MSKPLTQAEQDELNAIGNATITLGSATGKELGSVQGLGEASKGLLVPSAQAATMIGTAVSAPAVLWDFTKSTVTGEKTTEAGDWMFKNVVDPYGRDVEKYWRPDPNAMGEAAQVASGGFQLLGMVPQFFAAPQGRVPTLALGSMTISPTMDAVDQGASTDALYKIGAINLSTNAVGFALPAAWGGTLYKRMGTGMGANVVMGAAQRGGTSAVLSAEGNESADLYKWNDMEAMLFDAGVGGLFAGKLHYDAVNNQAAKLSPEQRQAVMTEVVNDHFTNQTMPGLPMNKDGMKQHTSTLDTAIQQVLNGERVDISASIDLNNFLVRPELRPNYAPISSTGKAAGSYGAGFLMDAEVYGNFDQFRVALESNGRADAKAATSSATGLHQFTEGTWLTLIQKNKPGWAKGLSRDELLDLRTDPEISTEMVKLLDQDNLRVLANDGLPVNFHTMYAMHHFGMRGKAFAAASGDVLMDEILTPGQIKANPYLKGKTKDQAIANWEERAKKAGAPTETLYAKAALAPEVKQADTFPNGVPKNLPEVDADVEAINSRLAMFPTIGADGTAQTHRGVRPIDQGSLPDQLASALRATDEALGIQTTVVRNLSPEVRDFHGTTLGDGRVYLNENSAHPVVTVAMHEFGHNLEINHPDLYAPLRAEIERQSKDGGLAFFKVDTKQANDYTAVRELTNNAIGDALTDPKFLRRMADENPTVFQKFADTVIKYLDDLLAKVGLKDYGTDRYLWDVATFRDMLATTLNEYAMRTGGFDERAAVMAYVDEIGWEQVGGRLVGKSGMDEGMTGQGGGFQVSGRTSWVPKMSRSGNARSTFWSNRPEGISEDTARKALAKFGAGKKLGAAEQRFIDYAKQAAKADEADRQAAFGEYMAAETARREADELFFSDKMDDGLREQTDIPDMPELYDPPSQLELLEMPMADREVAARMAEQKKAEYQKQLALRQKALSIRAMNRVRREIAKFPGTPMEALEHIIARNYSVKGSVLSVESQAKAVREDSFRQLTATLKATNPKLLGLFENNEGVAQLVAELHGTDTGNPLAKQGAKAFSDIANTLKRRFNRAGGDIGDLEDWAMPHSHSQLKAAQAGKEKWMADIKPLLNRDRYAMTDAELDGLLSRAWETIATNGVNKQTPGQFRGNGKVANHGSEARQIHFRDGDAYVEYQKQYGDSSPFETITGHIAGLSHDIALIESLGPNPDNAFTVLKDEALQQAVLADPVNEAKFQQQARKLDTLFREVSGKAKPVASMKLAAAFDNWRSLQVASKLGSAAITALTDHGTMHTAAAAAGVPQLKLLANELAAFDPTNAAERARIERMGLGLSTMIGELNRFGNDISMSSTMGKVATATMRMSGLMKSTDARRRAYGVTMMDTIGSLTRKHGALSELDPMDNRVLLSKGITEQDFAVWKLAELETLGANHSILTPDAIYAIPDAKLADIMDGTGQAIDPEVVRQQAVTRLLGAVLEEVDLAVVEPGAKERALLHGDRVRGTWKGEILSSVFLFKSFPVTMITKHWARMASMPTGKSVAAYGVALTASTTLLGMMSMQLANMLQGKDPRDMTDAATWVQALLKGGGLSLFGDYLLQDQTQGGNSIIASLAGPMAGTVEDVYGLTVGNLHEAAQGKDTHMGAELVKFGKNNTPLANLWYTRAATDHLIVNELQEMASPGYLRKMEKRAAKNYGDTYFWRPGESTPERLPNMDKAVGE